MKNRNYIQKYWRLHLKTIFVLVTLFSLNVAFAVSRKPAAHVPANLDWPYYAGDAGSSKFSSASQITQENSDALKIAWKWDSADNSIIKSKGLDTAYYEATPIMVNSTLYTSTSLNQVVALNPKTGKQLWLYDPKTYKNGYPPNSGFVHRGVAYWSNGKNKRILMGTNDGYLIALNADTGAPVESFGAKGKIDLTQGLGIEVKRGKYGVTSPPIVCKDTVIVGSSIADFIYSFGNPPGDVRGFDVVTGKLKWTFHTIPKEGEFGHETWKNNSAKNFGNANVWAPMSADLELGAVYLPVSTPSNDMYGGERPGDNLFAESLVSLNCETGKRNWHFQTVHHGLWDYDNPSAPVLMDIKVNGVMIKAVAQITKQAFAYVFDRVTGKPVWPINEKAVPQSTVPGEKTSPTQPFPTKPDAFDRQGLTENDLIDFTPELKAKAKQIISEYNYGPLFTPPSAEKYTINVPGNVGGGSWAGAAFNPQTGKMYVPSVTNPFAVKLSHVPGSDFKKVSSFSAKYLEGPDGLPLMKPPYGRVSAFNMETGDITWVAPMGIGPKDLLAARGIAVPKEDLGWPRRTHLLATPNLLFAVQSGEYKGVGVHIRHLYPNSLKIKVRNDDPALRLLNPETGELIAKVTLPANAFAAPMTYVIDGTQYVVMAVGGGGKSTDAGIVAVSLNGL